MTIFNKKENDFNKKENEQKDFVKTNPTIKKIVSILSRNKINYVFDHKSTWKELFYIIDAVRELMTDVDRNELTWLVNRLCVGSFWGCPEKPIT